MLRTIRTVLAIITVAVVRGEGTLGPLEVQNGEAALVGGFRWGNLEPDRCGRWVDLPALHDGGY